jgi:hypothetical protein
MQMDNIVAHLRVIKITRRLQYLKNQIIQESKRHFYVMI